MVVVVKGCLTGVLTCASLLTNDVEHFFVCVLISHPFYFVKDLLRSVADLFPKNNNSKNSHNIWEH